MSSNLNKYLHEVLRKDVKDPLQSISESKLLKDKNYLHDQRNKHFVLDNKFTLRLDEII
jgi:hypothetical protein